MKQIRRIHGWLGVPFAPSILLFALSGIFQISRCHESDGGTPPSALVVRMAQLHMKQTISMPRARPPRTEAPRPPEAAPAPRPEGGGGGGGHSTLPLRIFFVGMALSLIASTILGLSIAFTSK